MAKVDIPTPKGTGPMPPRQIYKRTGKMPTPQNTGAAGKSTTPKTY